MKGGFWNVSERMEEYGRKEGESISGALLLLVIWGHFCNFKGMITRHERGLGQTF